MAKRRGRSKSNKIEREANRHPVLIAVTAVLLAVLIVAIALLWYFKPEFFHKYLGAGEHTLDAWTEVSAASCTAEGKESISCSVCGEQFERKIPAKGHSWGEWSTVTEGNCGKAGKKTRICEVCSDEDSAAIPPTGKHNYIDGICAVCGTDETNGTEAVKAADLSIHFLELGNKYTGDCTLIKCGDTEVLIDAGSRPNSAVTIKNYIDEYCTDGVLEYVIATHAHQDHIAGFVGSGSGNSKTGILYQYEIGTLIQFAGHNVNSEIYKNYCTAVEYAKSKGTAVYTAKECWYETGGAKKQYFLDEAETVSLNILYQKFYDEKTSDENDYSVCALLTQDTGADTYNYLFTGDLEAAGESSLVDSNSLPRVKLFKGGHHGSYTASTDKLLKVIKPENIAVCCCCGTPEYNAKPENTFPAQAFIDRASKYTQNIYCTTLIVDYSSLDNAYTSMNGNIVFYTSYGELKLYCSNNEIKLKDTDWFKENRVWNGI